MAFIPAHISPLRYPGGKAKLAPALTRILAHQPADVFVEPFAGGAGAGLALLAQGSVGELWLTEKHAGLAALWRTILTQPGELVDRVLSTTPTLDEWDRARGVLEHAGDVPDVELGFAALLVNRCSRSGIVHPSAGPIGGRTQTGGTTITARWYPHTLVDRIRFVHGLSDRIRFQEGDALDMVEALTRMGSGPSRFLFVDPPYLRAGNRLYANGMSVDAHRRLAGLLADSDLVWLATYDDEPFVRDVLYPSQRVVEYRIKNSTNRVRVATEFAVVSDQLVLPSGDGFEVSVRNRDMAGV